MPKRTNAVAVSTIGIDTGKNTLHMIGLDEKGTSALDRMSAGCCATFPDHVLKSPRSGYLITAASNSADQCNTGFEAENGRNI